MLCHDGPAMKAILMAPYLTPFTVHLGIGEAKLHTALPADIFVDSGFHPLLVSKSAPKPAPAFQAFFDIGTSPRQPTKQVITDRV